MGSLHTMELWGIYLEPIKGRQRFLLGATSRVRSTQPNLRQTIICMMNKESTQEKRQDHIQDGQKILAKDAQVRTVHPTYGQGSH